MECHQRFVLFGTTVCDNPDCSLTPETAFHTLFPLKEYQFRRRGLDNQTRTQCHIQVNIH